MNRIYFIDGRRSYVTERDHFGSSCNLIEHTETDHAHFSVVVASLCLAATIGVSAAHADDDGWRRHEWREHHWRGEHGYRHHWAEPGQIYVERPRIYYAPPPVYYEPLPRAFGFAIGHEDDDDEE